MLPLQLKQHHIFDKIRIPAALLSGTLFASGLLQITDIASYKLPDASINFCLLILGASVGCRFAEKTVKEIANNSLHSIVATTILVLLGLIAAYIAKGTKAPEQAALFAVSGAANP